MKFKLSPGYWWYNFRDKNTKQSVYAMQWVLILKDCDFEIEISNGLKDRDDIEIIIQKERLKEMGEAE